jgi:trehalose/maltose hydrolase-like predicted phosphorylase
LNFSENGDFYITNLISLGIIEKIDTYLYSEASRYDELIKRNQAVKDDLQRQIDSLDDSNIIKQSKIDIAKGRFIVTTYGKQFIKSITLNNK